MLQNVLKSTLHKVANMAVHSSLKTMQQFKLLRTITTKVGNGNRTSDRKRFQKCKGFSLFPTSPDFYGHNRQLKYLFSDIKREKIRFDLTSAYLDDLRGAFQHTFAPRPHLHTFLRSTLSQWTAREHPCNVCGIDLSLNIAFLSFFHLNFIALVTKKTHSVHA